MLDLKLFKLFVARMLAGNLLHILGPMNEKARSCNTEVDLGTDRSEFSADRRLLEG